MPEEREYPGYDPDFDVLSFSSRFGLVARVVADFEHDMRQYLAVIAAVHNVGWFIDPTAYRDMQQRDGNADDLAELVRLALPFAEKAAAFVARFGDDDAASPAPVSKIATP